MNIDIMSRNNAIKFSCDTHEEVYAVISISDPDKNGPDLSSNPKNGIQHRIQLFFADVDVGQPDCITEEQAKSIAEFVLMIRSNVENLVVHCEAGMSRSAGVGAAVMKFINNNDCPIFDSPRFRPNMTCYRKVLNALYDTC